MKIAVVTGASSGIGLATATLLSQSGWRVWGFSRRGGKDGETLRHLSCDVTDEAQVQRAFQTVFETEGRLDLLVNNAGFGISGAVETPPLRRRQSVFPWSAFTGTPCSPF